MVVFILKYSLGLRLMDGGSLIREHLHFISFIWAMVTDCLLHCLSSVTHVPESQNVRVYLWQREEKNIILISCGRKGKSTQANDLCPLSI
jgi:hypothetical protein